MTCETNYLFTNVTTIRLSTLTGTKGKRALCLPSFTSYPSTEWRYVNCLAEKGSPSPRSFNHYGLDFEFTEGIGDLGISLVYMHSVLLKEWICFRSVASAGLPTEELITRKLMFSIIRYEMHQKCY